MKMRENKRIGNLDLSLAKEAFENGENVTALLRQQMGVDFNTPEIIEIAYDIQSGSYLKYVENNKLQNSLYCKEASDIVQKYIKKTDILMDVGTGEMTTLSLLVKNLTMHPRRIFAFDISWSRIITGVEYARKSMGDCFDILTPFVADMFEIPMLDKSVNVTISSHALEPNGAEIKILLSELFRVTKDKLVLFEPCYEINTEEGKKRMDDHGYIKGLDKVVEDLGGEVVEKIIIKNIYRSSNPTVCFVVNPPKSTDYRQSDPDIGCIFSVPGTNFKLDFADGYYFSEKTGLCFPVLKSVPVLKHSSSILATKFTAEEH
ncbi:MAG: class I SAM-dependent methyltransferase [Rhodospirillales bacterium]|nr:class I SAM-dependent methyltransferase [Rhodospirillales bacterium]